MTRTLPDWKCALRLSLIPKNGEPYVDEFELALPEKIEHWGQEYVPAGPLRVKAEASYTAERFLMRLSVASEFTLPCSRCLSETGLAINGDLRYLFTLRNLREERENEEEPADGDVEVIRIDAFDGELNLAPYVWEVLILSLPEGVLCSEDCRGLCPVCGRNLNEGDCGCEEDKSDPRFAVLRGI